MIEWVDIVDLRLGLRFQLLLLRRALIVCVTHVLVFGRLPTQFMIRLKARMSRLRTSKGSLTLLFPHFWSRLVRGQTILVVIFLNSRLLQRKVHIRVENIFLVLDGLVFLYLWLRPRSQNLTSSWTQIWYGILLTDSRTIDLRCSTSVLSKISTQNSMLLKSSLLIFYNLFNELFSLRRLLLRNSRVTLRVLDALWDIHILVNDWR